MVKTVSTLTPKTSRQLVKLADIFKDTYQRGFDYSWAKEIEKHYDPALVGTPIVSYRNGKYFVIDGQHRIAAMKALGIKEAMCTIIQGADKVQEAKLFDKFNMARKSINRMDLLRCSTVAGNEDAKNIVKIAKECGYTCIYDTYTEKVRGTKIDALAALERSYKLLGKNRFYVMLKTISNTWPKDKSAVSASMLNGLSHFWATHGNDIDYEDFKAALEDMKPFEIVNKANYMTYGTGNRNLRVPVAKVIYNQYNSRAKTPLNYKFSA